MLQLQPALSRLNNNEVVWAVVCHVPRYTLLIFATMRSPRNLFNRAAFMHNRRVSLDETARECRLLSEMIAEPMAWKPVNRDAKLRNAAPVNRTSGSNRLGIRLVSSFLFYFFLFIRINISFETIDIAPPRAANVHHYTNLLDKGRYSRPTLSLVLDDLNCVSVVSPDNHNRVSLSDAGLSYMTRVYWDLQLI